MNKIKEIEIDFKMDEVEEKVCVFEESFEIDFDYEFDVAKFFDFTQLETPEEIADSELWFNLAQGHPPSPLIVKLDTEADDFADSVTSSPRCGPDSAYSIDNDSGWSEVSSIVQGKKGSQVLKLKLKSTSQPNFPVSSRLLQPTASLLAKKNQYIDVSTRVSRRLQRLGNPLKSPGETDATKRQKLEIGYLCKVAQLKHETRFSHKSSKKAETTDVKSTHAKTKVTVPKEPDLATAHRALRQRLFKNTPQLENDTKYNSSSHRARPSNGKIQETQYSKNKPLAQFQDENVRGGKVANGSGMLDYKRTNSSKTLAQEKSDLLCNFRAHPLNKKILSSKSDIGVFRNCKRETTVPREFKLSNSKKLSQNPPTELFSKLSLIPGNHTSSLLEEHPLQIKVPKKNVSLPNMKENKNANAVTGKSMSCFGNGRRLTTDIRTQASYANVS